MDYWELRKIVAGIVPRMTQLKLTGQSGLQMQIKEKGRKRNYHQFSLVDKEWKKQERLLNTEEINSFLEISVRAAACPMPFNMDVWDGFTCPYNCIYCFANSFRTSLYTAFFDNGKSIGLRHCNSTFYKKELDKMGKFRGLGIEDVWNLQGINKAFGLEIPVRLGIRFEDFLPKEKKEGVSLELVKYLADIEYPVMINTKSALPSQDAYIHALSRNPAKAAVHVTLISSDDVILKRLEPGAPPYQRRLDAMRELVSAGVRVVARIEPYLFLLNDQPDAVQKYMDDVWDAGVRNITMDTYSYTANNNGIRQVFLNQGLDYDRMFLAGADSQPLGSLLLGKFMELFQNYGFSVSTFDMGNTGINHQDVCCEVTDWFDGGFNYGCTVMAARYLKERKGLPTTWRDYEAWVDVHGGFLSPDLRTEVKTLWNLGGNMAYSHKWAPGLTACGMDEDGIIWTYTGDSDYREDLIKSLIL